MISEGGQPVVLEDLKLLQDNSQTMVSMLMSMLTGGTEAFLVAPVNVTIEHIGSGVRAVRVDGGTLIYNGEAYDFEGDMLYIEDGYSINICIKREETDFREFEDNQSRPCRESLTAYLSPVTEGVYKSFKLDTLSVFNELLKYNINGAGNAWTQLRVIFRNGFSGTIKFREYNGDVELSVDVSTDLKSWDDASFIYRGWIGNLTEPIRDLLDKKTPLFTIEGVSMYLSVGAGGEILILPDGYEYGTDIPFVSSIQYKWKLSSMTNL